MDDLFSSITQPLCDLVAKMEGIVDVRIEQSEDNKAHLSILTTSTPSIIRIYNNLHHGSQPWEAQIIGTDTPSHLRLKAVFDMDGFTWDDFKREIDYKICLLKL